MLYPFSPTSVSSPMAADVFPALLPRLTAYLRSAFSQFPPGQRDDALQETLASAFVAFSRLCQQGRSQFGVPQSLARYAIAHWFAGRRVGSPLNGNDVLSAYAQRRHAISVEQLEHEEDSEDAWRASLVADHQTPIPDQVWFRIDFPVWLAQLSSRNRQIATALAQGDTARDVSQRFALSPGRVSQLRREFHESWQQFHGESSSPNESGRTVSTETSALTRP
jgi:hypothetical protein